MKFACQKKLPCKRCGQCCHFRESLGLTAQEEESVKRKLFEKTGVLYLYPFDKYTISITKEEMKVMEKEAKQFKIKIKFIPKRIFIDSQDKVKVLDWSIDHDLCPLYDEHGCKIYPHRPLVCQKFPERYELPFDKTMKKTSLDYEEAMELAKMSEFSI